MLTGMHPQTLRKYERAGFLTPSRNNSCRRYSDEDIERLKTIKRLVDNGGLNLAGVELALKLRTKVLGMQEEIASGSANGNREERLAEMVGELLGILETC